MNNLLLILTLWVLLLALDLVAVATRMSFLQISHARLLALRDVSGAKVNATLALLPVQTRTRATLNLLLVLTRFSLAGLAIYLLFMRPVDNSISLLSGDVWVDVRLLLAFAILGIVALLLFWFEWLVERVVSRKAELYALRLTGFVRIMMFLFGFLLAPLTTSNEAQDAAETQLSLVTEDELKTMVDAGQEDGVLELGERRMIYSIIELGDTLAREIMVPRIDMQTLDVHTPIPQAADALLASGHSRVPVYEESVDNTLGLLYAKELLRAWREDIDPGALRNLLRQAYFVPEAKKVDELLAEMLSQRIHMAIVVDEYGGVAGLVTLEDIVEEILGEIQDEYDVAEEAPYQELPDGGFMFLGRVDLDDFNEIVGAGLSSDEADTLGGYIYHRLGHVPGLGETVRTGDLVLTVEQVSGRRIKKVGARWSAPASPDEDEE